MRPAALLVAAGQGTRAGGASPKQFAPLAGVPVVARAFDALAAAMPVHVVVGAGQEGLLTAALGARQPASVTLGGRERADSVRAGLAAVTTTGATHVLIHDAARPLLPPAVITRLIDALQNADAAVPVLPVVDTLARSDGGLGETVARDALVRVQTPQAFRLEIIVAAHERWQGPAPTDDAQVARAAGVAVATVAGDERLAKLTSPRDFAQLEQGLGRWVTRVGQGFDVHRLEPGLPLWLCGLRIEHSHGLLGHSDADVGLHALTDAVLGAVGAGDIGTHFPPSDPQWRGAASDRFLAHAAGLVATAGGRIEQLDLTLICEAPKIGPHREAMRARVAAIAGVLPARVSIKATTTERLGFTGRGEGIAGQAIATVSQWEMI